jgi:hypothetical protein
MLYLADGQSWRGRRCLVESLRLHPSQGEGYRHLAVSLLPAMLHRRLLERREFRSVDGHYLYY